MTTAATPPEEINLAPKAVIDTDDDDTEIDNDELTSLNGLQNNNDNINNIPVIQRQTSKSPINIGDHSSSNGSLSGVPVGGSADTRRRITKLSKAREREKVPRLVEYFCVVSSSSDNNNNYNTAVSNNNNSGSNNNNGGGGGWTGAKVSGVNSVRVLNAQTCDNVHYYFGGNNNDDNDTQTSSSNNNINNNINSTTNNAAPPKLDGSEFQPKITARYPPLDHEENPLLSDSIIAFCYPSGKLPIYGNGGGGNYDNGDDGIGATGNNANGNGNMGHDADGNPHKESEPLPKVHYFVTTGESGQKMYGTCLTVWERHLVTTTTNGAGGGESKKKNVMDNPIYDKRDFVEKKNNEGTGRGDNDDDEMTTKQMVYLPKCLVILSMHPYLVAFREYLTQLHRLSKMASPMIADVNNGGGLGNNNGDAAVGSSSGDNSNSSNNNGIIQLTNTDNTENKLLKAAMSLPIERYITNFCSELPAPPPGSFEVQTTILNSVISIWSPPNNMPIAWVSLPFSHLFQCLDVDNVLKVWTALVS